MCGYATPHPIPEKYHELFCIGETDRRGNLIDFKVPPVIIDSEIPILEYKDRIIREHIDARELPMVYTSPRAFVVVRPTALLYRSYVREQLIESGLAIEEEFPLDNFMRFSDILYTLDHGTSFHWQWRVIMRSLHDTGTQDQNTAFVFMLNEYTNSTADDHAKIMDLKKRIRSAIGETPVIVRCAGEVEICLGIHHLHAPEHSEVPREYNVLMHARKKSHKVFSQD